MSPLFSHFSSTCNWLRSAHCIPLDKRLSISTHTIDDLLLWSALHSTIPIKPLHPVQHRLQELISVRFLSRSESMYSNPCLLLISDRRPDLMKLTANAPRSFLPRPNPNLVPSVMCDHWRLRALRKIEELLVRFSVLAENVIADSASVVYLDSSSIVGWLLSLLQTMR